MLTAVRVCGTGQAESGGLINGIPPFTVPYLEDFVRIWMGGSNPISWRVIGVNDSHYLLISTSVLGGNMKWTDAKDYCGTVFVCHCFIL